MNIIKSSLSGDGQTHQAKPLADNSKHEPVPMGIFIIVLLPVAIIFFIYFIQDFFLNKSPDTDNKITPTIESVEYITETIDLSKFQIKPYKVTFPSTWVLKKDQTSTSASYTFTKNGAELMIYPSENQSSECLEGPLTESVDSADYGFSYPLDLSAVNAVKLETKDNMFIYYYEGAWPEEPSGEMLMLNFCMPKSAAEYDHETGNGLYGKTEFIVSYTDPVDTALIKEMEGIISSFDLQ